MRPILTLTLILSLTATAEAGLRRARLMDGAQAAQHTDRTLQLNWQTDLTAALAEARRTDRLVLWVHMLGRIDGPT